MEQYKMVINKGNWSGEEVEITVTLLNQSKRLTAYKLEFENEVYFLNVRGDGATVISDYGNPTVSGFLYKGIWTIGNTTLQRDSSSPIIAAVQSLCNL
jgi:hypothetical protein